MFAALLAVAALRQSPASEVRAALIDCSKLPVNEQRSARYLSTYAVAPAERPALIRSTSYALNALSRSRAIHRPVKAGETLIRFQVEWYAPAQGEYQSWYAAWEALAATDPYWHLRTELIDPATGKREAKTAPGGWADVPAADQLAKLTGSFGAILRADWFVSHALVPPAYYDFAGVGATEAEFQKSLGVDDKLIETLRGNSGANLIISNITGKPRRIRWSQGPLGGYYQTRDVQSVDAERDPIRRPINAEGLKFKFDASEIFAAAPNGLWRTALFDAQGKRQDSVPDKIAKDTSDPKGDGIVTPLVSCIRCHTESGLRPFRDDQRKLLSDKATLNSYRPDIAQRAVEFYDEPRLRRQMEFDRSTYEAACKAATRLSGAQASRELAAVVRDHAYMPIGVAQMAREVGLQEPVFRTLMQASHDPLLIAGEPILRGQFESSFQEAALAAEQWRAAQ